MNIHGGLAGLVVVGLDGVLPDDRLHDVNVDDVSEVAHIDCATLAMNQTTRIKESLSRERFIAAALKSP